jgi:heptaprenylglyceryl phosphate synthase
MWTVWIVSTVINSTEPKYTRYAEVEHFETCEHIARDLEAEFTQGEYVVCDNGS